MRRLPLAVALLLAAPVYAQERVLDLTALANYANQQKPAYITRNNTPVGNPITDAGATLGRVLFYDRRLSRNNTVSCSSCHQQAHGFGDGAIASTGVSGTTARHSPRLINARFGTETRFFWDERAPTLENLATQPIRSASEMGFSGTNGDPTFADLITKLSVIPEYRTLFALAFGSPTIDEDRLQRAIAQFIRSIQSFDSRYDKGRATTPDNQFFPNFTAEENIGKQLFTVFCGVCHRAPEFDINPTSLNNGVTGAIGGGSDFSVRRSPSMRDLIGPQSKPNGPFMHNGAFPTLLDVVNHYNFIPGGIPNLDPRLQNRNLNLTQAQKDALVAFMETLTGDAVYSAEKWSDPFGETETLPVGTPVTLSVAVLSRSGPTIQNHGNGTATLTCKVARGLSYQLQSSLDLQTWTTQGTLMPDPSGNLTATVSTSGIVFYRFAFSSL